MMMRVMLDPNVLLDCLVVEASGLPRPGKEASDHVIQLCDRRIYHGLIAWHTLPILAYYHGRQHAAASTALMIDSLIAML
jgi:hypothetical protein